MELFRNISEFLQCTRLVFSTQIIVFRVLIYFQVSLFMFNKHDKLRPLTLKLTILKITLKLTLYYYSYVYKFCYLAKTFILQLMIKKNRHLLQRKLINTQ